jgi:hypothetical protein
MRLPAKRLRHVPAVCAANPQLRRNLIHPIRNSQNNPRPLRNGLRGSKSACQCQQLALLTVVHDRNRSAPSPFSPQFTAEENVTDMPITT